MSPDRKQHLQIANECTLSGLRKASRAVTQLYDEALAPAGIRSTQFSVLIATTLVGDATMTELAEVLIMDRTTLTRALAHLEAEGLVNVESGSDRRTRLLKLTERGKSVVDKATPLWRQAQNRMVTGLGKRRWETLMSDLGAVVALGSR